MLGCVRLQTRGEGTVPDLGARGDDLERRVEDLDLGAHVVDLVEEDRLDQEAVTLERVDVDFLGAMEDGRDLAHPATIPAARGVGSAGVRRTQAGRTCGARLRAARAAQPTQVVVHEPHRLHERVDRRRPDEAEAALGRRSRASAVDSAVVAGTVAARPVRAELHAASARSARRTPRRSRTRCWIARTGARVVDRRLDLAAVADDAGVGEQTATSRAPKRATRARDRSRETRARKRVALAEDREPREPGLEAFERELLEQPAVVDDRQAPLVVVVRDVHAIGGGPPTSHGAVHATQRRSRLAHDGALYPTTGCAKVRTWFEADPALYSNGG